MTLSRVLPLLLALAALPLGPAAAQFGGMPGLPGSPFPGMPGTPLVAPQQAPPAACQQLLALRDEAAKHGKALQVAGQKRAPPEELCKRFKDFVTAETAMIKDLEEHSATCGVPAVAIEQVKSGHSKTAQAAKRVCEVARQNPWPWGPSGDFWTPDDIRRLFGP
jgi:hypothetical protein